MSRYREELVSSLAQSLGRQKAADAVEEASRRLGIARLDDTQSVMAILGDLSAAPGIVGTVSRFVKVRWHLRR